MKASDSHVIKYKEMKFTFSQNSSFNRGCVSDLVAIAINVPKSPRDCSLKDDTHTERRA